LGLKEFPHSLGLKDILSSKFFNEENIKKKGDLAGWSKKA
jgi:hypothetical protein